MTVQFFIPGLPAPGGSKKAFVFNGRARLVDAGKNNKSWKQDVKVFAAKAMSGREPFKCPLRVEMCFYSPRPQAHFGTGKNVGTLKASAPRHITKKPDVLKLARSTEDAMTGVVYHDDAQTVCLVLVKKWCDESSPPGCRVIVQPLSNMLDSYDATPNSTPLLNGMKA